MKSKEWDARGWAYSEAADHLRTDWTDNKTELFQGDCVADRLEREAAKCWEKAKERRRAEMATNPTKKQ